MLKLLVPLMVAVASASDIRTVENLAKLSLYGIKSLHHPGHTGRRRLQETNTANDITLTLDLPSGQTYGIASWTGLNTGDVTLLGFQAGKAAGPFFHDAQVQGQSTRFNLPLTSGRYEMKLTTPDKRSVTTSFVVQLRVKAPSLVPIGGPLNISWSGVAQGVTYGVFLFPAGVTTPFFLTPPGSPARSPLLIRSFNRSWTGPFTLVVSGGPDSYGYAGVCIGSSLSDCSSRSPSSPSSPSSPPSPTSPTSSSSSTSGGCPYTSSTNNPCRDPACAADPNSAACVAVQRAFCSTAQGASDAGCSRTPTGPNTSTETRPTTTTTTTTTAAAAASVAPVQLWFPGGSASPGGAIGISWAPLAGNVSLTVFAPDSNGTAVAVITAATSGSAGVFNWTLPTGVPAGDYSIVLAAASPQGSGSSGSGSSGMLSSDVFFLPLHVQLSPSMWLTPSRRAVLTWTGAPATVDRFTVTAFKSSSSGGAPPQPYRLHNGTVSSPFAFTLPPSLHGGGYFLVTAEGATSVRTQQPLVGYVGFCNAGALAECGDGPSTTTGATGGNGEGMTLTTPSDGLASYTPVTLTYWPSTSTAQLQLVSAGSGTVAARLGSFMGGSGGAVVPPQVPAGTYFFRLLLDAPGSSSSSSSSSSGSSTVILESQPMALALRVTASSSLPPLHGLFAHAPVGGTLTVRWPALSGASYDVAVMGPDGAHASVAGVRGGTATVTLPPSFIPGTAGVVVTQTLPLPQQPPPGLALRGVGVTHVCVGGDAALCLGDANVSGASTGPVTVDVVGTKPPVSAASSMPQQQQQQGSGGSGRGMEAMLDEGSVPGTLLQIAWSGKRRFFGGVDLFVVNADSGQRVITVGLRLPGSNVSWAIPADTPAGRYRLLLVLPDGTTAHTSAGRVLMTTTVAPTEVAPGQPLTLQWSGGPALGAGVRYTAVADSMRGQRWVVDPAVLRAAAAAAGNTSSFSSLALIPVHPGLLPRSRVRLRLTATVAASGGALPTTVHGVAYFCVGKCPAPAPAAPTPTGPVGGASGGKGADGMSGGGGKGGGGGSGSCSRSSRAAIEACRAARGPGSAWTCDSPLLKTHPCPPGSVFSYAHQPPRCVPKCGGGAGGMGSRS